MGRRDRQKPEARKRGILESTNIQRMKRSGSSAWPSQVRILIAISGEWHAEENKSEDEELGEGVGG